MHSSLQTNTVRERAGPSEAADAIVSERDKNGPYKDIFDFIRRINFSNVTSKNIEYLVLSGAFDDFKQLRREDFFAVNAKGERFIDLFIRHGQKYQQEIQSIKNSLFGGDESEIDIATPPIIRGDDWSNIELLNKERELVGIYLSAHPLNDYQIVLENLCNTKCSELAEIKQLQNRQQIVFGGIVTSVTPRFTKQGKPFGIIKLEDFSGGGELALWSEDWGRWNGMFQQDCILYITATLKQRYRDSDFYDLKIQNVEYMQTVKEKAIDKITISINTDLLNSQIVEELAELTEESPGKTRLFFLLHDSIGKHRVDLRSMSRTIDVKTSLLSYIKENEALDYKIN